mmetsp:Transcript_41065/g.118064  ORF Transcript_41065/g.118064 Transcript_41065/m.118064 type:complete len:247 (-) Transcript_41065:1023-1763(-)
MFALSRTTLDGSATTCHVAMHLVSFGHIGAVGAGTIISTDRTRPLTFSMAAPTPHGPMWMSVAPVARKYSCMMEKSDCQSSSINRCPKSSIDTLPKSRSRTCVPASPLDKMPRCVKSVLAKMAFKSSSDSSPSLSLGSSSVHTGRHLLRRTCVKHVNCGCHEQSRREKSNEYCHPSWSVVSSTTASHLQCRVWPNTSTSRMGGSLLAEAAARLKPFGSIGWGVYLLSKAIHLFFLRPSCGKNGVYQ